MQRFLIAFFTTLVLLGIAQESKAQFVVQVSGYLLPGQTRVFHYRTPNNSQTKSKAVAAQPANSFTTKRFTITRMTSLQT